MIIYKIIRKSEYNSIIGKLINVEGKIFTKHAFTKEMFKEILNIKNDDVYGIMVYESTTNALIGYMLSQKLSNSDEHRSVKGRGTALYLESIGIIPQYQNKGIGKRLMKQLMEYAKNNGYKKIIFETSNKNLLKLVRKIDSNGSRILYYNKNYYDDEGAWIISKKVQPLMVENQKVK
jgi:ribosomal protein S18 acetylase RimI-like enzyme